MKKQLITLTSAAKAFTGNIVIAGIFLGILFVFPSAAEAEFGSISGRVIDSESNPIANIPVAVENYETEELIVYVLTDANGFYACNNISSGVYVVGAWASYNGLYYIDQLYNNTRRFSQAAPVTVEAPNETTDINFQLSPSGAITGTVTDGVGNPIADMMVQAEDYDDEDVMEMESLTDANGVYVITGMPPGDYRVFVNPGDSGPSYVTEYYDNTTNRNLAGRVTITGVATTDQINFSLTLGTYISGYVSGWDADSNSFLPLQNAFVSAENFSSGGQWAGGAESDVNGFYRIAGLAAGQYRVRAEKSPYIQKYYANAIDWAEAQPLSVGIDTPAVNINFELGLGGSITGTLVDEDTLLPITNAWVNVNPANGEPWGRGTSEIDGNGVYVISGLPAGSYKVSVNASGYDQEFYDNQRDWMLAAQVAVTVEQTVENINFAMKKEAGGALIGRVVLPDDTPVANANVNANSMENMRWKNAQTDPNGNFRLTGITAGKWSVRAAPPWGQDYLAVSESSEMQIMISDGVEETDVGTITLPTVNLIGQVLMPDDSPAPYAPVNIEAADASFFTHVNSDQEGYFRAGGLSAGAYKIRVELPWGTSGIVRPSPMDVEITDTNTILNIGAIHYSTAVKHVAGTVRRSDSSGVQGAEINGWRHGADGWAHTQSDADGSFSMDLPAGTWEFMVHPSPQASGIDWVYLEGPKAVTFTDDSSEETKTVVFTVETASCSVTGSISGPNGEVLREGSAWVEARDNQGRGNGMPVSSGGQFSISVREGTYNIWVGVDRRTYSYWSSPRIDPVTISQSQTIDLGEISLVENNSGVRGTVTRSSDGAAVSGVSVHAWKHEGGWTDTTTDENGNYQLSVNAGEWEIAAEPPYTSSYISGQPPRRVVVPDGETVSGVDFELVEAGGTISGSVRDSDGNILSELNNGWAYAREDMFSFKPLAGAPMQNGQFSLKVPVGVYYVGVHLPPNSGYTISGEEEVIVDSDTPVEVAIEMMSNDAFIAGAFYTNESRTTLASGIEGEVFAMQGMGGMWQSTRINSDGTYSLQVSAGTWNLGYRIISNGYINNPPPNNQVTVESGQTASFDFTLMGADATIRGVIQDPNGLPLSYAFAWAHSEGTEPGSGVDSGSGSEQDGTFSISVPSGREYVVGAHAPESLGYMQPESQTVTPASGQTVDVVLRFQQSNAVIMGRVYYTGDGNTVACGNAFVNAWSGTGQNAGTPTDSDGNYQLNVISGSTWYIEAVYVDKDADSVLYRTNQPTSVAVSSAETTVNLEVVESNDVLPESVSATFDPNVGWSYTLDDGTRIEIPAGAIPADGDVGISITPLADNLQKTVDKRPVGWGYEISVFEQATGTAITDSFNTNVLLTFNYDPQDLEEESLTEDSISPAYFSSSTNSWTKVESFSIDKDAKTITVQVNHFSTWALTGIPEVGTTPIDLTIQKCTVTAGKTVGKDQVMISGTFDGTLSTSDITDANQISVSITAVTDDYEVYSESISVDSGSIASNRYIYRHSFLTGVPGGITNLTLDLTRKTFSLKTKNISLTGLSSPLLLEITIGDSILSGQAAESVINGRSPIPMNLLKTYDDALRVDKAKATASGKISAKGAIAVQLMDDTNLTNEDVTIAWGDQTFTIPQGSFIALTGKKYRCSKIVLEGGAVADGSIDLDACKFNLTLTNASPAVITGTVNFGISFATFNETAEVSL